jgi:hypothetical protein
MSFRSLGEGRDTYFADVAGNGPACKALAVHTV